MVVFLTLAQKKLKFCFFESFLCDANRVLVFDTIHSHAVQIILENIFATIFQTLVLIIQEFLFLNSQAVLIIQNKIF